MALPLEPLPLSSSDGPGSPWPFWSRTSFAGGDRIEAFLERLRNSIVEAGREAMATVEPSVLTLRGGRCDLPTNRNLLDPANPSRDLTDYNPANRHSVDDTFRVGRAVCRSDGVTIATLVNYACHPTTLAGESRLVSPGYIGRMREVVEGHSAGGPVHFLQGASGDLGPAVHYVDGPAVADPYGGRLRHAVLSTLLGMEAHGKALRYIGPVESGAPLAYWELCSYVAPRDVRYVVPSVGLPTKPRPRVAELGARFSRVRTIRGCAHTSSASGPLPASLRAKGRFRARSSRCGLERSCSVQSPT